MIFFLLIVLFALYFLLCAKFSNPYKLTFVFGKKGAGKSCYMVRQMLKYRRKGWTVYTDMADVRIPDVRIIDIHFLETFAPEPHSLICLDEVGISMDNRSFKTFSAGLRDFFKYSRKMQLRVILNSQAFDVDKKVRDTTDDMILMQSIGSLFAVCRPIRRSITLTEPVGDSESRIADTLKFCPIWDWQIFLMPLYWGYFDSKAMPSRPDCPYAGASSSMQLYSHGPWYVLGHNIICSIKDVIDIVTVRPNKLFAGAKRHKRW